MARTQLEVVLELKKTFRDLKQCAEGSQAQEAKQARIDELLDERLEQKGTHPADCSCWECSMHVADVMSRRVAEMHDPRGIATEGQW